MKTDRPEGRKVMVTVSTFGQHSDARAKLEREGCTLVFPPKPPLKEAALLEQLPSFNAIIAGGDEISAPVLSASTRLSIVARFGVGVDKVDVAAATRLGIWVGIATNQEAVADLTLALLLALARRLREADAYVRAGSWGGFAGMDVYGRTIGVIGTGRIGQAVLRRARAFTPTVLASDPRQDPDAAARLGFTYVPLEELLRRSDFITVNCALTDGTRGLIGEKELSLVKPTVCIVNTARAPIVVEGAIVKALREKRVAGFATDVFEPAPPPRDFPLFVFPNVIVTPWFASYTPDTHRDMELACAENVLRVFRGEPPLYACNQVTPRG
ncbi:MAG TPA: phosphoglycerate dehydrogenase [Spirochaetia bacterium]|nr:phosphoglycerate dehydrogenase [Spirochaetia bacterium]